MALGSPSRSFPLNHDDRLDIAGAVECADHCLVAGVVSEDGAGLVGIGETPVDQQLVLSQAQAMSRGAVAGDRLTELRNGQRAPFGAGALPLRMPVQKQRREDASARGDVTQFQPAASFETTSGGADDAILRQGQRKHPRGATGGAEPRLACRRIEFHRDPLGHLQAEAQLDSVCLRGE